MDILSFEREVNKTLRVAATKNVKLDIARLMTTPARMLDKDAFGPEHDQDVPEEVPRGFERGLEAERILGGCFTPNGGLNFLIKWRGDEDADIVPSREANRKCPIVVLKFYIERLSMWRREDPEFFNSMLRNFDPEE